MKPVTVKQRKQISQYLATALPALFFVYFGYHLLHGDRGYFALKGLQLNLKETQDKYEKMHDERMALENRVKLMRPDSLDLDMLDEQARSRLGYVNENEKVILAHPLK